MMRKSLFLSITVLLVFGLVGCSKKHLHSYDFDNPKWTWENSESGYSAKVTLSCADCDENLVIDASVSSTSITPSCESDGSMIYTATATYDGKTLADSKTESVQKLGHQFDTLVVEGDYRKSYVALESFDSSTLVVKAICSREGCGTVKTLSQEEYFVIYQTQGIDHLCAGDTKVTISANYAPFAKIELTGLTVTKIPNAINGMHNSYTTSCHQAPDLSGVTTSSGDLELKYYSDSGCTNEISLNNLSAGTYYIKATSTGVNYETVTQVATLNVVHVFDQCVEADEFLHSASTRFANATYYKSCICGAHSTSVNDVSESVGSKLAYVISSSAFSDYTSASLEIPTGYTSVSMSTTTFTESNQGTSIIGNIDSCDVLDKMNFMILTKNNALCQNNWSGSSALQVDQWYAVEIIKDASGTYSSTIKDENGIIKIQYSNKGISQVLPYYQWGDETTTEIYSTEVYGVRCKGETFNELVSESAVPSFTTTDIVSPKGYQTVTLNDKTFNDSDQSHTFLKDISISGYQSVSFAFKTKNRRFCKSDWSNPLPVDTWHICTYERNNDGTYECIISTMTGQTKFSYSSVSSFRDGLPYYNWDGSAPNLQWYSTEVRGVALQS